MSEINKGDGVTQQFMNDRVPWTVLFVHSAKKVSIQRDKFERIDKNGHSESQTYRIEPDPKGEVIQISLRHNGLWYQVGKDLRHESFTIGKRSAYRCPSF